MIYRKVLLLAVVAFMVTAGSACTFNHARVPEADIPFARADYDLGDKVSQETCNTYILGINFAGLFGSDKATVPGPATDSPIPLPIGGPAPEVMEAMYMAVQKMPDATHVVEPRTHVKTSGLLVFGAPLFGSRCGRVEARAATIKGPYEYGSVD